MEETHSALFLKKSKATTSKISGICFSISLIFLLSSVYFLVRTTLCSKTGNVTKAILMSSTPNPSTSKMFKPSHEQEAQNVAVLDLERSDVLHYYLTQKRLETRKRKTYSKST